MGHGRRRILVAALALTMGLSGRPAPSIAALPGFRTGEPGSVRLTVEIRWGGADLPALPPGAEADPSPVELSLTAGRVVEAQARPEPPPVVEPGPKPGDPVTWRLGLGPSGRVRVRVEAPLGASLLVQAGGQLTGFPLADLIESPQTTLADAPMEVRVERLPWDALELHLAEGDGVVAPGARVPVALGFNILTPEPISVVVRHTAELRPIRGGPPVWRHEGAPEVMTSNQLNPAARMLTVAAPPTEGTYLLEVHATWEPAASLEGSRIARLLRRRKAGRPETATRRVSLAVLGPRPASWATPSAPPIPVDSVNFERPLGGRPAATGRSPSPTSGLSAWAVPEAATVDPGLRDRLRGWFRGVADAAVLPPADPSGLAWSAVELRVPHPGRPHRLVVRLASGAPEMLGVALVVPGGPERRPRVLLDACACGPPPGREPADGPVEFSWPAWPDAVDPVLVVVNRGGRNPVALASVELVELPGDPRPAPLAEPGDAEPRRLALNLSAPGDLDRFGGAVDGVPADDALGLARNLAAYLAHLGASTAVLPGSIADDRDDRSALDGQAEEDALGPDRLAMVLRILERRGADALLDLPPDAPLPGLPSPASPEAEALGLLRIDGRGRVDLDGGGPAYQPLHPEVAAAYGRRVSEAIAPRLIHRNLAGLLIRLGPGGTLPGGPTAGLDDVTYAAFVKAMFQADDTARVPGLDPADPGRFAARAKFVDGPGRTAWLDWRAERVGAFYAELAAAVRKAAPGALLAVATPGLDDGPAGREARRADRAGLPPSVAWRAVGLDLGRWPASAPGLVVLRGADLGRDGPGAELATNPELDAAIAARPSRGLKLGPAPVPADRRRLVLDAVPLADDAPLGHALAVLDPALVVLDGAAVAGQEPRVARFARVFRALPGPPSTGPPTPRHASGVAVRTYPAGDHTYLAFANDTPYEVLQAAVLRVSAETPVDDLGRSVRLAPADTADGSGKQLVLRLPPFGVAAVRVGGTEVKAEPKAPHLPELPALEARAEQLSVQLGRLARGDGLGGPPSPGFEPAPASNSKPAPPLAQVGGPQPDDKPKADVVETPAVDVPPVPAGWSAAGAAGNALAIDRDRPHGGLASLRLDARALPASAASDPFLPPGGEELILRAWLRADRPDARVRIWFEGEEAGHPLVRQLEVEVGRDWAEQVVRVPKLPEGGLDGLRLRFEWLGATPGILWLDDLALTGEGPSDSGRRAQQVLVDALQAYRLKRYADFARLVGSPRARRVLRAGTVGPEEVRTGRATDLPPGRRLR